MNDWGIEVSGTTRTTVLQITSAREAKTGFAPVDAQAILAKVASLPLSTWAYTNNPGVRHVGPVAQDFAAAFALGDSDKHIATVDADGVALTAIQGLYQKLEEQLAERDDRIRRLEEHLRTLEQTLETQRGTLEQRQITGPKADNDAKRRVSQIAKSK